MREIKFRVYDEESKSMEYEIAVGKGYGKDSYVLFLGLGETFVIEDKLKIMQYTGIQDKNRVEIYDGDIIRDGSRLWIVEISNLYGVVLRLLKDKKITRPYIKFEKHLIDDFEVVGDIYENEL